MDRNQKLMAALLQNTESLSARRAWIEIGIGGAQQMAVYKVALRKESVDRNKNVSSGMPKCQVALRKESVDRNQQFRANFQGDPSRSPQGERG